MTFATTWMDLEIIILSEVRQRKTNIIQYHIHGILKNNTNELIYKTETFIDIGKKTWLPKGIGGRERRDRLGIWE